AQAEPKQSRLGRRLVRATGWSLVSVGLLVLGFVVYELWFTSFWAHRAQDRLEDEFNRRSASVVPEQVEYRAAALPEAPVILPEGLDPLPASGGPTVAEETPAAEQLLPGEDLDVASYLLVEPALQPGDALGRIIIRKADVDWTVVEGVGRSDLRKGVGHMPATPVPGQPGNAVLSGHRTTYGAPFSHLDRLEPGDVITVETGVGIHVYQVVETLIVKPTDVWVTDQWSGSWLTLTTCNPRFSSRQRLVVISRLVDGPNAASILGAT
ncbi:MAG: sortase, partial [Acidimicrobiia bacterium]